MASTHQKCCCDDCYAQIVEARVEFRDDNNNLVTTGKRVLCTIPESTSHVSTIHLREDGSVPYGQYYRYKPHEIDHGIRWCARVANQYVYTADTVFILDSFEIWWECDAGHLESSQFNDHATTNCVAWPFHKDQDNIERCYCKPPIRIHMKAIFRPACECHEWRPGNMTVHDCYGPIFHGVKLNNANQHTAEMKEHSFHTENWSEHNLAVYNALWSLVPSEMAIRFNSQYGSDLPCCHFAESHVLATPAAPLTSGRVRYDYYEMTVRARAFIFTEFTIQASVRIEAQGEILDTGRGFSTGSTWSPALNECTLYCCDCGDASCNARSGLVAADIPGIGGNTYFQGTPYPDGDGAFIRGVTIEPIIKQTALIAAPDPGDDHDLETLLAARQRICEDCEHWCDNNQAENPWLGNPAPTCALLRKNGFPCSILLYQALNTGVCPAKKWSV